MSSRATLTTRNLGDLLHHAGVGDRTALIDLRTENQPLELTATELDRRIRRFAQALRERGMVAGSRVGFLSDNRWEMLVGYLGTMVAGAVSVPINHKFPQKTVEHILGDSRVELVFHDDERSPLVPEGAPAIAWDSDAFQTFSCGPLPSVEVGGIVFQPQPGDLAEILYTSGSTGLPKGVPLDHQGQLWALSKYLEPLFRDGQRTPVVSTPTGSSLIVAPLYHMNALFFSSVCLLNAMTIVLQPRFDAARYIAAVAKYRCTHLSGVPTMFALLATLGDDLIPADLSFVRSIFIGSAPLSDTVLAHIRRLFPEAVISNGYGTTEAGPAVFGPHPEAKPRPLLSIGYPFDDIEWRLIGATGVDETGGVLELRTAALTDGYINRPEATAERFLDGWYRTNDVMRRDEDGFFYFVSRADDMFVCGGENIYPSEVEQVVNRHPAVRESVVVRAPDDIKGAVPIAFVVTASPHQPSDQLENEIKRFCLDNAPPYLHPRRVLFRDSLPLGGTHKIDRRELEKEATKVMVEEGRASG